MKSIIAAASAALLMLSASAALAQGPGSGVRQACAADHEKFCPGKTGQEGHQCMMAHKDEVSDTCKSAAKAAMEKMKEMKADKPE